MENRDGAAGASVHEQRELYLERVRGRDLLREHVRGAVQRLVPGWDGRVRAQAGADGVRGSRRGLAVWAAAPTFS